MIAHGIDPLAPLIVMYHYVWPHRPPEPAGVRPLLVDEFERQLDLLQSRYKICHAAEFLDRVDGFVQAGKPPCLLTFDDGTIDHAKTVTPILAGRGLTGVFFVLSGPATGLMPMTHAIHWALSIGDEAVWKSLAGAASEARAAVGDEAEARKMYHYEPPLRARIKYAANVALPGDVTATALRCLAVDRGTPLDGPDGLARRWFASEEQLTAMHRAGMTLGVHGHSHRSLQQTRQGVREEMQTCAAMIRRCTGAAPKWWACPFGGTGADQTLQAAMHAACDELGIGAAVGTESRSVRSSDDRRCLPRVDCVRLPPRLGDSW